MTARTRPRCILIGAALSALLLGRCLISLPPLNTHAVEKHGTIGVSAWSRMASFDPGDDDDDEKYWEGPQEDGRTVRILRLDKLPGKRTTWAVVIICGGLFCVTAFLTQSRSQVQKMKDKCR